MMEILKKMSLGFSSSSSVGSAVCLIVGLLLTFQLLLVNGQVHVRSEAENRVDLLSDAVNSNSCGNDSFSVCCSAQAPCAASNSETAIVISSTGTHIYPPPSYTEPIQCQFEIPRQDGVCQVRLDFVEFEMAQPSNASESIGDCVDDALTIIGSDNLKNFKICGRNKGQHLYLHYGSSSVIFLTTRLHSLEKRAIFDILVTFINCTGDCTGAATAPAGCSQYYTKTSDTVQSFNYEPPKDGDVENNQVSYQLNNQKYTVCVKESPGSTEISWQTCKDGAFAITGFLPAANLWQPQACPTDYVDILGGNRGARFCGTSFPGPVTSVLKPFILGVNFDNAELLGPNYEINPTTGCCIFCQCVDGKTQLPPVPPVAGPCKEPNACQLNDNLMDRVDINNIGFCLTYSVS